MEKRADVTDKSRVPYSLEDEVADSASPVLTRNLTKSFGSVLAVDDVSLDIAAGEFVSLLGPSGSGKSTILMMLAGFELPTAGEISFAGRDVTDIPPYDRDIGMVFQSYALFPHMTVYGNIAYPLRLRKVSKPEVDKRVMEALEIVRLPANTYASRYPQQLSGGQCQRIALARALVYEPRVLLMDEPMGALDRNLREELKLELISLQERLHLTIVYVTHDQGEAMMLSDRVAVMRDGRIEQIDHPEILYRRPNTEFVANFLGEANLLLTERQSETEFKLADGRFFSAPPELVLAAGQRYLLMLRPEDIEFTSDPEATLYGKVENTVYLGNAVRAEVDTPLGMLTVMAKPRDSRSIRTGQQVGLRFTTEDSVLVPASKPT